MGQSNSSKSESEEPWLEEHRDLGDGGYRAAIFGFNDGLVTNLCLIIGVQFALEEALTKREIIVTGLAGLISGSLSMAMGEWISMSAQSEALKNELKREEMHLDSNPEWEENELSEILQDFGLKKKTINAMLADLRKSDIGNTLDLHARLELGIDPTDQGSPLKAGCSSFICWMLGAISPMIPYFIWPIDIAWIISVLVCVVGSFVVGVILGKFSKINKFWSGIRQFGTIAISAGSALLIGYIVSLIIAAAGW